LHFGIRVGRRFGVGSVEVIMDKDKITVYYDGACPKCIRDRQHYEKLAGKAGEQVCWFDITGQENRLRELGIDPGKALTELHVSDEQGRIVSELDAYILLMKRVPILKPIAWLIGLPLIRSLLARIYHRQVNRRLRKRGLL
jgi:predicted DCC family thiol-disulfide oxidoreductase YuxK